MKKHSLASEHMIETMPSYAFEESNHQYKRQELNLPENRFVTTLVGNRLNEEIDTDCMDMLQRLTDDGIYIAFVGKYDRYRQYAEENETFRNNSICLGYQKDLLAVYECCDLYINPKRLGGGTSAAGALYKGLPVVTFDFGDIGTAVGADFHVSSYEEMYNQIMRYYQDEKYYAEMTVKAKERASCITNIQSEFMKVLQTVEASEWF